MDPLFPTFRSLTTSWPRYTTAAQSQALLRLIAVGIEEKLPLAPLIEAWSMDERGVQRGKLLRLATLLGSGMPLDDAIEEVPGVMRDEELLAIRFDAQSGTRTAAMRALLDDAALPVTTRQPEVRKTVLYFCILLLVAAVVVTYLQINILPVFSKILAEFAVTPPEEFVWSQRFGDAVVRWGPPVVLVILALLWYPISTRAGRRLSRSFAGRFFNPSRAGYAANVLQMLGVAIGAGRPLAGTLSTLARYHFDPVIRQQLLFARNEVEQRADVWQSLIAAGLITGQEAHLLNTGERLGNQPWVLAELVSAKKRRTTRRWELLSVFFLPLLVVLMGGFVLWQALTIFMPLIEILRAL